MPLEHRQRIFLREYLVDLNTTQAAKRTGITAKLATRYLKQPEVALAIERALAEREQRIEITADRVLAEIGAVAFSDARKLFRSDGSLLPPNEWPADVAGAVSAVEVNELWEGKGKDREQVGFTKKVKLWDKPAALQMLGKHLKLWADQVEVVVNNMTEEQRILRAEALITAGLARLREREQQKALPVPAAEQTVDAEEDEDDA